MAGGPLPTERQVQRAILGMVRACFPDVRLHHSPGGAHLAGSATARFKQMGALKGDGMKVGFPDLIALWPEGKGAFLEVKRAKRSVVSDEQKAWIADLNAIGWPAEIVRSVDDAHEFLKACGAPCKGDLK